MTGGEAVAAVLLLAVLTVAVIRPGRLPEAVVAVPSAWSPGESAHSGPWLSR